MRKTINNSTVIGRIYSHELVSKTVQKQGANFGKPFIRGKLEIATDDEGLNIVPVFYTYESEFYSSGKKNRTYDALKSIVDGQVKTVVDAGFENATIVKCDTSVDINDFYVDEGGPELRLVSAKRLGGGFVTSISKDKVPTNPAKRNIFDCDMLITGTQLVESEDDDVADYLKVKGAVFNFAGAIIPVDFICRNAGGIKYFESLDASSENPTFTRVWGNINSQTIVEKTEEESAFGDVLVTERTKNVKEWVIEGASPNTYPVDDSTGGISVEEFKTKVADRETHLAEVKANYEDYQKSKGGNDLPFGNATAAPAAAGGFNF